MVETCKQFSVTEYLPDYRLSGLMYSHAQIVYCAVAKTGSTMWKSIIRFLNRDCPAHLKSPYDMSKATIHYGKLINTSVYHMNNLQHRINASRKFSFMFSRNPYTRLWSAYIDKIYLPDFWISEARIIVKQRQNHTIENINCPDDITFAEFVEFVVKEKTVNRHWMPVHRVCSPCHFHFDYIGKQETFDTDSTYILDKFNISRSLPSRNFTERLLSDTAAIIDKNFAVLGRYPKYCLTTEQLAERLWRTFKITGYISDKSKLDLQDTTKIDRNIFRNRVVDEIKRNADSQENWGEQRYFYLRSSYQSLTNSTLNRIRKYYQLDFALFGYDPKPPI